MVKEKHLIVNDDRANRINPFRPHFGEYSPHNFANQDMKACPRNMHIPESRIPDFSSSTAKLCMTSGKTEEFAKWKQKTTNENIKSVGSLNTANGVIGCCHSVLS